MKLAFVFDGLGIGGIERVGIDYVNAMARRGHDVTVVNLVPGADRWRSQLRVDVRYLEKRLPRYLCPERYAVLARRFSWGTLAYLPAKVLLGMLLALMRPYYRMHDGSFDVVVAFSGHYNDLTYVAKHFADGKARAAWLHGTLSDYKAISNGFERLYEEFDTLVCLSEVDGENTSEVDSARAKLRKVYNPVTIGKAIPADRDVRELQHRLGDFALMVARLEEPKDPIAAIDALAHVRGHYGDNLNLVFVGDGSKRRIAQEHAAAIGLRDNVFFEGYSEDPGKYYAACEFVLLASRSEGLPTTLIEGMAMGRPVVATKALPGVVEILGDSEFGIVCDQGEVHKFAEGMHQLFSDSAVKAHYVRQSKKRARDFEPEKAYRTIEGLFLQMCTTTAVAECIR